MKTYNYRKFASMTPEQIGKLKTPEVRALLVEAREMYAARSSLFEKQGRYFYSPAYEKMKDYYKDNPPRTLDSLTRNRALAEIFNIQNFFQLKTSTVKGAREVMRQQDIRIFGVNKKTGRPLQKLTKNERTRYWDIYREFTHQKKTAEVQYGSEQIQQFLGESFLSEKGKELDIDTETIDKVWQALREKGLIKEEKEDVNANRNVFTGRRNNRKR